MTIELSRRGFCIGTALIGLQSLSSSAFAARSEDGTVRLGLVAPMSGPNARYGAFSLRGAQTGGQGDQRRRRRRWTQDQHPPRRQPGHSGRRRLGNAAPDRPGPGRLHHRRRIELGDARDAAGRRGRRRAAPQCRLVQPEDHLQGGRRRVQMDLPQLPDRREPRADRAAICRREEGLHEIRGALGRHRLRARSDRVHQEVPAALQEPRS